jgi:hypothetical protein
VNSTYPPYNPPDATTTPWTSSEDDILICMQNAIHDPQFVHTLHWLNSIKEVQRTGSSSNSSTATNNSNNSGSTTGSNPRTIHQAKHRYAWLVGSGKKDSRLLDPNVQRTITKLVNSIKRNPNVILKNTSSSTPVTGGSSGSTSSVIAGTGGSPAVSSSMPGGGSAVAGGVGIAGSGSNMLATTTIGGTPIIPSSGSASNITGSTIGANNADGTVPPAISGGTGVGGPAGSTPTTIPRTLSGTGMNSSGGLLLTSSGNIVIPTTGNSGYYQSHHGHHGHHGHHHGHHPHYHGHHTTSNNNNSASNNSSGKQ